MLVAFRRTHARGYAVVVRRDDRPDVVMNPAPGFDELLPHDLCHFLVERHWRLRDGIYGQVAKGGDAGTFRLGDVNTPGEDKRARARRVRRLRKGAAGGSDIGRSEQLASVVHARWEQRRHGRRLPEWYPVALTNSGAAESEILAALAEAGTLAEEWRRTEVGDELVLSWS